MIATTYPHGPLTGGIITGTVIAAIVSTVCLLCIVSCLLMNEGWGVFWSAVALFVTVAIYIAASWPFAYEYHHWIPTRGKIASIGKRIVSDGDGNINQKYVFTFEDGRVRALNDTIGAVLRPGDQVIMRCKKAYDYGTPRSSQGWDCKWSGTRS